MPAKPSLQLATNITDALRRCGNLNREPYAAVIDLPWVAGPAGTYDLFEDFSRADGKSIRLIEAAFAVAGRVVPIYMVPRARLTPFLQHLDGTAVLMPDGRLVRPTHTAPYSLPAWLDACPVPDVAEVGRRCYVIGYQELAADAPGVAEFRRRAVRWADATRPRPN